MSALRPRAARAGHPPLECPPGARRVALPRPPQLPQDVAWIAAAVKKVKAALVVIDPLMAYLAGEVNSHRDQDVRRGLHPLAHMAEQTGAAVVVIRHLNKVTGGNPLYRGG